MEKVYTSCIKMNGVPILPPLMSQNLMAEMKYYKHLATEVEKRLKSVNSIKELNERADEIFMTNVNDSFNSKIEHEFSDAVPYKYEGVVSIDYSTEVEKSDEINVKSVKNLRNKTSIRIWKSVSTEGNTYHNEVQSKADTSFDDVSLNINLDQYSNKSTESSKSPEQWKEQEVPKTLDISASEKDLNQTIYCKKVYGDSEACEEALKSFRRGTYILESPSAVVQAHIKEKMTHFDYVPTGVNNTLNSKDWNSSNTIAKWENQLENNEPIIRSSTSKLRYRLRSNSFPSVCNQKAYNICYSKNANTFKLFQRTRSADYIHDMIINETGLNGERCNAVFIPKKYDISHKKLSSTSRRGYKRIERSLRCLSEKLNCQRRNEAFQEYERFSSELCPNDMQPCSEIDPTHEGHLGEDSCSSFTDNSTSIESFKHLNEHYTVSRKMFPSENKITTVPVMDNTLYTYKHIKAVTTINKYTRGYLIRKLMKTEHIITLRNLYKESIKCMLKLYVEAPLNLSELKFLQRLQLQCDAASMSIVETFSRCPAQRIEIIAQDRKLKKPRTNKPNAARSYSFATQRTLARKKL